MDKRAFSFSQIPKSNQFFPIRAASLTHIFKQRIVWVLFF